MPDAASHRKPSLSKIFAGTHVLELGAFRITGVSAPDWKDAQVYIAGYPVSLPPVKKTILALLLREQGAPVNAHQIHEAFEPAKAPSVIRSFSSHILQMKYLIR